ncbi:MAG: PilZ domain-containing protein [Polyangiales bacterium]
MPSDKRRHHRTPIRQRLWCEGEDLTLYVQALNASAEGMFIRTPNPAEAGRRLRVSFRDAAGGRVVADVEVRWSRPAPGRGEPGMGVRIVGFEEGQKAYRRFVDRHLKSSSPGFVLGVDPTSSADPDPS